MTARKLLMAIVGWTLVCSSARAWHPGGRMGGSARASTQTKPFEWPGRYQCDQCTGSAPNACWSYELTIMRSDEKNVRGEVTASGPGLDLDLKAQVVQTLSPQTVEFHFTEPTDVTQVVAFRKDALLFLLQYREDDIVLHFSAMTSRVANQSTITCKKNVSGTSK